ncbi:MAG: Pyrrolo-quinoline quinone [Gammaproteobacteria bacterium]|nr:Pyrrolo-quinoline quinone [Gammaproteobacteria bacterium]
MVGGHDKLRTEWSLIEERATSRAFRAALLSGLLAFLSTGGVQAQAPLAAGSPQAAGHEVFATRCASCHGTNATGGEFAPSIVDRVPVHTDDDLRELLHNGLLSSGMPAFPDIVDPERANLISFLRTLKPSAGTVAARAAVTLQGGKTLEGVALNRSAGGMQLLGDDHRLYLLRKTDAGTYRSVTSQSDWPSYNGQTTGSRYSALSQITTANASRLQAKWVFTLRNTSEIEATPVVADGVMYVTYANECFALDAGSGRQIWHYQRPRTRGIGGVAAKGANRGAAVAGDRVFMATDNAHLIALDRTTGKLIWDTAMADWHQNYNATSAPLAVGTMVVSGIAGGDEGARGFVVAYDQTTGKEVWRFWTVPKPGEPGSETWQGAAIDHPGGSTWMTGTYDQELHTLYWPVGNPGPDLIGDDRLGDNLYTDSIVALDPDTGKLKWYFQFTPHDVHDFDAMAPPSLIDATWQGKPRKLMVQANRNGFLYVLDRTNGKFLLGRAYTKRLTWATGLTPEGRPLVASGHDATYEGRLSCPWLNGASNWYSASWNPLTSLYYVQTNDKCGIFTRTDMHYQEGRGFMGGSFSGDPADPGQRILRAFDIHTGKAVWELPQTGDGSTFGGVLSTAGGLVFYGADDYSFAAADAKTGKPLWSFQANQPPHASPMTYLFDEQQYVAVAIGSDVIAFGLPN